MLLRVFGTLLQKKNKMSEVKKEPAKLNSVGDLRKTMDGYFGRLKEAVDTGNKKIAWCTSVGPAELLYAMGFEVYFPENHGAMLGAAKLADKFIPTAVAHGYSPDICSYLTCDIGAFLVNETPLQKSGFKSVPKPDVLVFNTNQCKEVDDWFSWYSRHFNVPIFGISTPLSIKELNKEVLNGVEGQIKALVPELEKISGQKFDIDKYRETTKLSHDACALWRKVLETAKHKPSPINFFDSAIHMGPVVVMRGTQYAYDYYKILLAELEEKVRNNQGSLPTEKLRIYWDGMPLWYKLSSMSKMFANLDTCIVASTYCNSWVFDDLDPADPFGSAAYAYSKLFIVRADEEKEKVLQNLLSDFSCNGIIYHDSKTCCRNSNNRFGLPVRLAEKTKLPYLEINGDLCDSRCYSEEQSIIAIETFVDQLKANV